MANLKDIAREAGVSVRTVSRVLNETGYAGAETRRQVRAIARRLGYRPNRAARALRRAVGYDVAAVVLSLDELHMAKIAGLEHALRPADYSVTMAFGPWPGAEADVGELIDGVIARRPAGVVLLWMGAERTGQAVERLCREDLPYVVIDADADWAVDAVRIDRPQGVYEAALYLAGRGRQRIAYFGHARSDNRLAGYRRAMEQLGREEIVLEAVHLDGRQVDYSATAEALLAIDPPVDAVQAFSDELAMQLLAALYRRGVGVPDPLAIVGFDDRRAAQWAAPPLTTVAQPSWQVGQAAGEIILRKIAGEATPPGGWSRWLPTRLVRRVSA